MDFESVFKDLFAFTSDLIEKVTRLENMLKDKEREMKSVNVAEIRFQDESKATKSKIQQLNAKLTQLKGEKRKQLEDELVSQGLTAIDEKILKFKQRVVASSFPECSVCYEVCNPSQGRLVFCCPDGHTICGQCAERLDKCPTCRRETSSFGGRFTRVREFENLSGKPFSNEDNVDFMLSISELAQEKQQLVKREKEISALYEGKMSPLQKELDEEQCALSAIEEARCDLRSVHKAAEAGLTSLVECLRSNLSTLQIERGFDFFQEATSSVKETLKKYSLACACDLACPHPLAIQSDGRISGEPCGCIKQAPCLCVTHQITLDIAIEGGSSGSVTIDLAGGTNPRAVSRFYRCATSNFYAGHIVNWVKKNDRITLGGLDVNGKVKKFTSFTSEQKVFDSTDKHLLQKENQFVVGIWEDGKKCENHRIIIYMKNAIADSRFRTVGVVTKGAEIIEEINNLSVEEKKKMGCTTFFYLPKQITTIKKSSGRIVTHSIQLFSTAFSCSCDLSCPHPLLVGREDGRILSEPCGCLERGPCICATHQITLDLAIEGGSSGSVTIDLAGRTNPCAVWRMFKLARENFYAGLIVETVYKNDFMVMGLRDVNGKLRKFTSFTPAEKKIDTSQKHLLHKGNKFEVGIVESKECEDQSIIIYTGNRNAHSRLRTVGVVTKGTEIIEEINNRPVEDSTKIITMQKSSGRIVTPNVQL